MDGKALERVTSERQKYLGFMGLPVLGDKGRRGPVNMEY